MTKTHRLHPSSGGGILVCGLISSPFDRLISFFGKDKSGSEEMRYCSRCGKTTLHSYISEYELKCKECGNVTEEDKKNKDEEYYQI